MKIKLAILISLAVLPAFCQQQTASLSQTLSSIFEVSNTNGIIYANEVNFTPLFEWDAQNGKAGGAIKADWWVSQQQGMAVKYSEFQDRSTFWAGGYQARTLFKGVEVSLGTGVSQDTSMPLGDLRAYVSPSVTFKLAFVKFADARLNAGCDVFNASKPTAFIGVTFRFLKQ
jgi:hypothetical protein